MSRRMRHLTDLIDRRRAQAAGKALATLLHDRRATETADALRLRCTCGRSYLSTLELIGCTHGEAAEPASAPQQLAQAPRTAREAAVRAGLLTPRGGDPEDGA